MPDLVAAVAEPNRRRLLQLLGAGEQTVGQLASHFTVTRSAISQHLGVLADSGLVTSRRAGKFQYYRLNARGMTALRAELDSFWTRELASLVRDARDLPLVRRPACRRRVLRGVAEADYHKPTVCTEFDVTQLADHLIGSVTYVGAAAGAAADPVSGLLETRVATAAPARPRLVAFTGRTL